ncbi:hypothetical protein BGZ80_010699 [Entomortierella chlamydospora]|uniref:Sucrose transporter n=1 Tax=Entomortierella chlamydospora TaxID=101097 RepID=A0A9P6SZK1_9FUNG|nr:hypothetical protein BGZ80_010699 [Entomortierella chlamydospora]
MDETIPSTSTDPFTQDPREGVGIAMGQDTEDWTTSQDRRKPGLHGRARIWGPNRAVRMILLTTSLMGLQFTWSVEMAYGTPFLLQLGLSKSLMSLVWLAGPLSGLVMQPVLENVTILMAVGSIYILDFAINCVQASCRTLIVDSLPSSQQEIAASWASRLMGIGGILGYFMGNVNIPQRFPFFGDTQIKGLCVIACLFLIMTVGMTCLAVTERVMVRAPKTSGSSVGEFFQGFRTVLRAIRYLPTRIQHLCNVQFFAWMGWFPFLFYSSTYIAEIYTQEQAENGAPIDPDLQPSQDQVNGVQDAAVRAGSFCLLIYSIVSLAASIILPLFVTSAEQTITGTRGPFSNSRESSENGAVGMKRFLKWNKVCIPQWLKLPITGLTLPRMYTISLALLSFSLVSTWYVHDLRGSTILFSFCGIAWAVSMWAPFSILGEVISQRMQEEQHQERIRASSQIHRGDSTEILFHKDGDEDDDDDDNYTEEIGMVESGRGRPYQPLKARESLEEVVAGTESNFKSMEVSDSFRNHSGTPPPTTIDGQPTIVTPTGWSVRDKVLDASPETEVNNDDHESDQDIGPRNHMQDEERRLVKKSSNGSCHSRSPRSRPDSHHIEMSDRNSRSSNSFTERGQHDVNRPSIRSSPSPSSTGQSPTGSPEASSAGALLGIHNIYIVLPQFLVSFLSSLVFAAIEPRPQDGTEDQTDKPGNPETIGVMLRIGGVMAGIAAVLSLRLWKQPRTAAPFAHVI